MADKIALLIDAENTSVKYVNIILKELKQYGDITVQRMYGDFSDQKMSEWKKKGIDYAIVPIHQSIYTTGKNAADIMLVIDAMDILYDNKVDGFCIVTSDSDFTRLANRLREGGKRVIGMGKSDASKAFISACNEYKFIDKINEIETEDYKEIGNDISSAITPLSEIKNALHYIVQQAENNGERVHLGSTKSQLQREFADFDERNYGYSLFRKFIEDTTKFKVVVEDSSAYIVRKKPIEEPDQIEHFIIERAKCKCELGTLGSEIHKKFPGFKYQELGFSKLSKYLESINQIKIVRNENNNYVILK